jgi:hypothetical protein
MIAALFVETGGVYYGLPDVDPWDRERDARNYNGPWPVVAHPPCERWGRYWSGGPSARVRRKLGDDNGCFASALASVRKYGGVLEHPEGSHAWRVHGLNIPPHDGGWVAADWDGGFTCCVEQGYYGHKARKKTWLYACGVEFPSLRWGRAPGSFMPLEDSFRSKEVRARAVKTGACRRLSKRQRAATPVEFRDVLISIAHTASPSARCPSCPRADAAGRAWPSEALPAPSPAAGLPQAVDSVSRAACGFMSAAASQAVVATDGELPAERV